MFRELQGCVCLGLLSLNPIYSRLGMGMSPIPTTSKLALSEQWEAPMKLRVVARSPHIEL